MTEEKLVDKFPSIVDMTATLFRYDRWDKLLLFEIYTCSNEKLYLACYGCQFIEFSGSFHLNQIRVIKDAEVLILDDSLHNVLLKCKSIELWNQSKFSTYDIDLYKALGEEKRYGFRRPISSIEELL